MLGGIIPYLQLHPSAPLHLPSPLFRPEVKQNPLASCEALLLSPPPHFSPQPKEEEASYRFCGRPRPFPFTCAVANFYLTGIRIVPIWSCYYLNWMRLLSPAICLRISSFNSMYSHSSQLQGGFTQSMALYKCLRPHSSCSLVKSGFLDFSLCKNIVISSEPHSLKYFVSLAGRQFHCGLSTGEGSLSMKLDMPSCHKVSSISWNWRGMHQKIGVTAGGLCLGFLVSGTAKAETHIDRKINCAETSASSTHGKKVYTDYSVTGIPGDGRCLFRSVVHGACVTSGKPIPNEDLQRKLADELRSRVADEFISRREETEWFVEGDFDTYVNQIRKPHVWGGEPELFMASHVLQMPITVYMHDEDADGLITIAEYGQEYGKEDPIQVLYHGFGHYDSLQIPANRGPNSRL